MPLDCITLYQFPLPQNLYETLFAPIRTAGLTGDLESFLNSFFSSFSMTDIRPNAVTYIPLNVEQSISKIVALQSLYNMSCVAFFRAGFYRSCELLATAVQHKIEMTNLPSPIKFFTFTLLTLAPIGVSYYIGLPQTEMIYPSVFKIVVAMTCSVKNKNKIKELDLIVPGRQFSLKDFIIQNAVVAIRNRFIFYVCMMGAAILVRYYTGLDSTFQLFSAEPLRIQKCKELASSARSFFRSAGGSSTLFINLFFEFAWTMGKVAVDFFFILLAYIRMVGDLRDPINSLSLYLFRAPLPQMAPQEQGQTVATIPVVPALATDVTPPVQVVPVVQVIPVASGSASAATPIEDQWTTVRRKAKRIKNTASAATKQEVTVPSSPVAFITVPNYARRVVALSGTNIHMNLWGVITYRRPKKEQQPLKPYKDSLNGGNLGGQKSGIKYLGDGIGIFKNEKVYEVRPKSQEKRLLGVLVRGEKEVYRVLSEAFGYARALGIVQRMKKNGEEINMIDFQCMVTHNQIRDYVEQ